MQFIQIYCISYVFTNVYYNNMLPCGSEDLPVIPPLKSDPMKTVLFDPWKLMLTKFILFLKYIGPRGAPLNTIFTFVSRIMWIFGVTGLIFNHLMGIIPHHLMASDFKGSRAAWQFCMYIYNSNTIIHRAAWQ